jgi:hypothetical protein
MFQLSQDEEGGNGMNPGQDEWEMAGGEASDRLPCFQQGISARFFLCLVNCGQLF